MKSKHKKLLNELVEMQERDYYQLRWQTLQQAEQLIVAQERQIEALLADAAKYRAVAAVSPDQLKQWDRQTDAVVLLGYRKVPQLSGEFKTLYVKD